MPVKFTVEPTGSGFRVVAKQDGDTFQVAFSTSKQIAEHYAWEFNVEACLPMTLTGDEWKQQNTPAKQALELHGESYTPDDWNNAGQTLRAAIARAKDGN